MSPLVRKIDRTKWLQNDIVNGAQVSADAITNCMKTRGNNLSVWSVRSDSAFDEAVLAMSSEFQYLETIDIVALDDSALADAGLQIVATRATTPVTRLAETHRDITALTYTSLGIVAGFIVERFRANGVVRFTKGQLRTLLRQAIEEGSLRAEDLKDRVRLEVSS